MIQWNLTLTGNQIAILKSLQSREFGKDWSHPHSITHWVGGVRTLVREGLIEQRETKLANGYVDPFRSGQFLTERGRFILDMIELDIAKFLKPHELRKLHTRPKLKVG